MKKTMGEIIKENRLKQGFTQEELAQKLGLQKSAIAKYENGRVQNIKRSVIQKMAYIFETSPTYLMGLEDEKNEIKNIDDILEVKTQKVPLLGTVACGVPIYAEEEYGEFVEFDEDIKVDFALRCQGDSMINARIYDGDIVFVRKQPIVENGEIAVVLIDDEATLKRVIIQNNILILQAENNAYPPITFILSEDESLQDRIKILGKAVAFQSKIK